MQSFEVIFYSRPWGYLATSTHLQFRMWKKDHRLTRWCHSNVQNFERKWRSCDTSDSFAGCGAAVGDISISFSMFLTVFDTCTHSARCRSGHEFDHRGVGFLRLLGKSDYEIGGFPFGICWAIRHMKAKTKTKQ
jgi:hypothetical protein